MGTIDELFSFTQQSKSKSKLTCSFCSTNKPDAFWYGRTKIYLCALCAVDKMPKLIADAFVQYFGNNRTHMTPNHVTRIQLRLSEMFMQGVYAYGKRRVNEKMKGLEKAQRIIDEVLKGK